MILKLSLFVLLNFQLGLALGTIILQDLFPSGSGIDWAMGEALAFGSLLLQGYNVRLSGEDVSRGTFSNRHVTMYDQDTGAPYTPLNYLQAEQTAKVS